LELGERIALERRRIGWRVGAGVFVKDGKRIGGVGYAGRGVDGLIDFRVASRVTARTGIYTRGLYGHRSTAPHKERKCDRESGAFHGQLTMQP
jgi:hypothetical protein